MSFMDEFSGYNQINMYPDDEKHTSFKIPLGVYYYTMMPFGLKNVGASYRNEQDLSRAHSQDDGVLYG